MYFDLHYDPLYYEIFYGVDFECQDKRRKHMKESRHNYYNRMKYDDKYKSKERSDGSSREKEHERKRKERSRSRERRPERKERDRYRERSSRDKRRHSRDRSPTYSKHRESHSKPSAATSNKHKEDNRYRSESHVRSVDHSLDLPHYNHHKGQRKMAILEKLGIDLVVPDNLDKTHQGVQNFSDSARVASNSNLKKSVTVTGELAAYCNDSASNSKIMIDRLNRKKLLWNKAPEQKASTETVTEGAGKYESSKLPNTLWQTAVFSKDNDGKQTAKFKRLMGIKDEKPATSSTSSSGSSSESKDLFKKQEEMFQNMEMQYEVARASTHTHRGIGLGFGIHQYPR